MEKLLTIGEVEEMDIIDLEDMLSTEQIKRIEKLGITTEQFLSEMKDNAVLTGEDDNKPYMTISDFIGYLEGMDERMKEEIQENTQAELTVCESQKNEVTSLSALSTNNTMNRPQQITNITDKKMLFNLGRKVDKMLNDCEGQIITIDKVLVKKYQKQIDEPVVNEMTGEIISDKTIKTSMSIVIVDENGVSYATGSKSFGYSLIDAIFNFGDDIKGLKIKIIKTQRKGNQNKSLDFELV